MLVPLGMVLAYHCKCKGSEDKHPHNGSDATHDFFLLKKEALAETKPAWGGRQSDPVDPNYQHL